MKDRLINFRDFGGLPTEDGGTVAFDLLYRCGKLCDVGAAALQQLIELDFATIVDLRYRGERRHEPSPWPASYAERVLCHDGDVDDVAPHLALIRDGTLTEELTDSLYCQIYREFAFDNHYRPLFAQVISQIAESEGRTLIHCTAGKDRTGILAAMILTVAGVSRERIVADYLMSAQDPGLDALSHGLAIRLEQEHGFADAHPLAKRLFGVEAPYLLAFFDEVEKRCGSLETYLGESGVDRATLARLKHRLTAS